MEEQDYKLTLHETEQLCSLYMDCKLSIIEENELKYFLNNVDYHSPLIDEVRQIMDIDTYFSDSSFKAVSGKLNRFSKWTPFMSIAASIAIVVCIGISLWKTSSEGAVDSRSYYVAYADGHRLNDEAAKIQIEAGKKAAEDFIKEMTEIEASKQQMIDNFLNP